MASRTETNFRRLLHRCEQMASERKFEDWRLEKYISTLQDFLIELRKLSAGKPSAEAIAEYTKKVDFLKGLIETEKLPTVSEKVLAAEHLHPVVQSAVHTSKKDASASQQLRLTSKARFEEEMRDELLGTSSKGDSELRNRKVQRSTEEDIDSVLKHHNEIQEKLAEEMVNLARNLKENAMVANRIVKDDTEKLSDTNKLADTNYGRLQVESSRLEKYLDESCCNWWMWVMLVLVCFTFIAMVVFMRLFPKA
ncbi:hypothetical protein CAPTEDRAFT_205502 [Capitella teleta]|uniref:Vesicle transport protein USE1 n=1 Tax=Capitella teleta TaxID=283909 RepID=R7TLP2_CAPTE|nr:hypothetical protein CAPTEDRAFT_205502 [Capitella teleta]|eukprot:ELT92025.1 hypothetical protein CAPTEDRAFT_205502 [Capitella teleta]